jgi:hypothetical protein
MLPFGLPGLDTFHGGGPSTFFFHASFVGPLVDPLVGVAVEGPAALFSLASCSSASRVLAAVQSVRQGLQYSKTDLSD